MYPEISDKIRGIDTFEKVNQKYIYMPHIHMPNTQNASTHNFTQNSSTYKNIYKSIKKKKTTNITYLWYHTITSLYDNEELAIFEQCPRKLIKT